MKVRNNLLMIILIAIVLVLPIEVYGFSLTMNMSKLIKLVLLILLSVSILTAFRKEKIKYDAIVIYQVLFLLITFSIIIFQPSPTSSILKWSQYLVVYLFYFAIIQPNFSKSINYYYKEIESAILIGFIINLIVGIIQIRWNLFWPAHMFQAISDFTRPVGLFNNSNGLGGYFVVTTMYFLWAIIFLKRKKYYLYFFLGLYSLWISGSEGSYLSFVLGSVIVLSSLHQILFKAMRIVFLSSFILLVISIWLSEKIQEFIVIILQQQARYELWYLAWVIFKDNWVVGIGNYTFFNKISEYGFVSKYGANHPHPHNIFLDFLVSYGVFGLVLFLLVVFYVLIKYIKYKPIQDINKTNIMVLALLIQALVHDIVDGGFLIGTSSVAIFQLLMIAIFAYHIPNKETNPKLEFK